MCLQLLRNQALVQYRYRSHRIHIYNDSWSSVTYHILFSTQKIEKLAASVRDCETALDVGANCGIFAYFLLARFPNCRIACIEPSEKLHAAIKANTRASQRVSIHAIAISDTDGVTEFHVNPESEQTNAISHESVAQGNVESMRGNIAKIQVACNTLDTFAAEWASIDVLKVDIQGGETALLRGAKHTLEKTKQAFFEISLLDPDFIDTWQHLSAQFPRHELINDVRYGADVSFAREL